MSVRLCRVPSTQTLIPVNIYTDVLTTTNATPLVSAASSRVIASGTCGYVELTASARNTVNGASMVMRRMRCFKNVAGVLSIVGNAGAILPAIGDAAMLTALFDAVATGTTLQPRVTGIAATTIEWLIETCYTLN